MPERDTNRWRRYLRFWGPNVDADIDDELRYHLEMRRHDFMARGMAPDHANDAAVALFGDPSKIAHTLRQHDKRLLRQARTADMLQDLRQDVRYGARQLRNAPRFTTTVVLVLALGIGANTAIFSAIDAAFLRPLPFPHAERLVTLRNVDVPFELSAGRPQTSPMLDDFRADSLVFAKVAAYASGGLNLTGGSEPIRANITYVTQDFFATLERAPVAGRVFAPEEFDKGARQAVVISYALWQRQFGGDASAIGRTLSLNDKPYVITGVMPADFTFPAAAELWLPLSLPFGFDVMPAFRNFLPSQFVARLAPGVTITKAVDRSDAIRHRFSGKRQLETPRDSLVHALPLALVGNRRTSLLILMASAALLLLIACANVTNLLLARASSRQREMAVRIVLGATRVRVLRQLSVESLLLSLAGGTLALVVARVSLSALTAALPPALAGVAPPQIDARVLAFTFLLATVTSFTFGIWPALGASKPNLGDAMKAGAGATKRRGAGARGVLVVAEMSIALMLLIGAGLMLQSLRTLLSVDTGMRTAHVVTGRLTFSGVKYPHGTAANFLRSVVSRLSAMPGVDAAGAVSALPMEGVNGISLQVMPEDDPDNTSRTAMGGYLMATPGFFKAMGASLRGEDLPDYADTTRPVAVINEVMAKRLWPNQDAIGHRLKMGSSLRTVIGVVADIRNQRLDEPASQQMYWPMAEQPQSYASIVVRSSASASTTVTKIRDAVRAIDANQPVYALRAMEDVINTSVAPRRTNTLLLSVFGALALLLAGVGVYGVLSYGVAQRTREIGVRVALGAQRTDVLRLVVRQGVILAAAGIAIGLAGAYALSRIMSSLLYEESPHDPRVFLGAPAVLALIALFAVLLPALRATRVSAMTALREE